MDKMRVELRNIHDALFKAYDRRGDLERTLVLLAHSDPNGDKEVPSFTAILYKEINAEIAELNLRREKLRAAIFNSVLDSDETTATTIEMPRTMPEARPVFPTLKQAEPSFEKKAEPVVMGRGRPWLSSMDILFAVIMLSFFITTIVILWGMP